MVDPKIFYEICLFDTSRCGNYTYCEALYGYARACDHEGVCVDWRSDDVCRKLFEILIDWLSMVKCSIVYINDSGVFTLL